MLRFGLVRQMKVLLLGKSRYYWLGPGSKISPMELPRVLHHGGCFRLGWVPTCLHISRVVDHRLLLIVLGPIYALGQLPRIFVDLRLKHLLMLFS